MTPSAHAILSILLAEGPTLARELVKKSGLPPRTVYWALNRLRSLGAIEPHEHGQKVEPSLNWKRNDDT